MALNEQLLIMAMAITINIRDRNLSLSLLSPHSHENGQCEKKKIIMAIMFFLRQREHRAVVEKNVLLVMDVLRPTLNDKAVQKVLKKLRLKRWPQEIMALFGRTNEFKNTKQILTTVLGLQNALRSKTPADHSEVYASLEVFAQTNKKNLYTKPRKSFSK